MNSHEVFIHIHQGCFAGTGAIVRLPQCQWSKPDGYGKISQWITTTKHSKAKTVCIFLGIYCNCCMMPKFQGKLFRRSRFPLGEAVNQTVNRVVKISWYITNIHSDATMIDVVSHHCKWFIQVTDPPHTCSYWSANAVVIVRCQHSLATQTITSSHHNLTLCMLIIYKGTLSKYTRIPTFKWHKYPKHYSRKTIIHASCTTNTISAWAM